MTAISHPPTYECDFCGKECNNTNYLGVLAPWKKGKYPHNLRLYYYSGNSDTPTDRPDLCEDCKCILWKAVKACLKKREEESDE